MFDPNYLLSEISASRQKLGDLFGNPLSLQEEMYLTRIHDDIYTSVNASLHQAMESDHPVLLHPEEKNRVMDLLTLQRGIRTLLDTRGNMQGEQVCFS